MVKLALPYGVAPTSLLLLRLIFAAPFYLAILLWIKLRTADSEPLQPHLFKVILLGFVGYYLASYFDFVGLSYITAGLERVILYAYPTLVLLISAVALGKKISLHQMVAVALCYLGIFIAIRFGDSESFEGLWLGAFLVFLSALAYAIYLVGSGELIPKMGVWLFTSCAMLVSFVCVVIHHLILPPTTISIMALPWQVYGYALAMAIFATVIPSFLISEGIKRIGASNASIIGGVGPISTIVLASIFLGEAFTVPQAIGTAVVIGGVIYISVNMKKENRP